MVVLVTLLGSWWRLSSCVLGPLARANTSPRDALLANLRREVESQMGEADFITRRDARMVFDASGSCSRTVVESLGGPSPALTRVQNLSLTANAMSTASAAARLRTSWRSIMEAIRGSQLAGYGLGDGSNRRTWLVADAVSLACDVPEHRDSDEVGPMRFFARLMVAACLLAGELALLASIFPGMWSPTNAALAVDVTLAALISAIAPPTELVRPGAWEYEARLHREMTDKCAELKEAPLSPDCLELAVQRRLETRGTASGGAAERERARQPAKMRNRSQGWRAVGYSPPQNHRVVLNHAWRPIQPERALASMSSDEPLSCRSHQALIAA